MRELVKDVNSDVLVDTSIEDEGIFTCLSNRYRSTSGVEEGEGVRDLVKQQARHHCCATESLHVLVLISISFHCNYLALGHMSFTLRYTKSPSAKLCTICFKYRHHGH